MRRFSKLLAATLALSFPATVTYAAPPKPPVIQTQPAATTTVTGELQYHTVGTAQFRVGNFILIHSQPDFLKAWLGQQVVVTGSVLKEPNIYMAQVLEVKEIYRKEEIKEEDAVSAKPVPTNPDSGADEDPVTILPHPGPGDSVTIQPYPYPNDDVTVKPVPAPGDSVKPAPAPRDDVTIQPHPYPNDDITVKPVPAPKPQDDITIQPYPYPGTPSEAISVRPAPISGTASVALYGQVERTTDGFLLTEQLPSGTVRWAVNSTQVDLGALVGRRVAAVATANAATQGRTSFVVEAAVATDRDLAATLAAGTGILFQSPMKPIQLQLRGQSVTVDQAPIFGNGRTLVPLRAVVNAMGAQIHWQDATQTATVSLADRQVLVRLGSNVVIIRQAGKSDRVILNDTAPVVVGGRIMVPARVLSEGLGLQVQWDPAAFTVSLQ